MSAEADGLMTGSLFIAVLSSSCSPGGAEEQKDLLEVSLLDDSGKAGPWSLRNSGNN